MSNYEFSDNSESLLKIESQLLINHLILKFLSDLLQINALLAG